MAITDNQFPTSTDGIAVAGETEVISLSHQDSFALRVAPVAKRIGNATVRMLAYNGSVPGPTLHVRQGSEVNVDIENQEDLETTVHWHGLRLANRFDGTHETQAPVPVGGRFSAQVAFPDPGRTDLTLAAARCEVVRIYLTNAANTRVYNIALPGARMKLVGGDSGRVEREELVDEVILAPSERAVVDVLFPKAGTHVVEHRTPDRVYRLATIYVGDQPAQWEAARALAGSNRRGIHSHSWQSWKKTRLVTR